LHESVLSLEEIKTLLKQWKAWNKLYSCYPKPLPHSQYIVRNLSKILVIIYQIIHVKSQIHHLHVIYSHRIRYNNSLNEPSDASRWGCLTIMNISSSLILLTRVLSSLLIPYAIANVMGSYAFLARKFEHKINSN